MATPLRALIVEDSLDDATLLIRELRRGGYEPHYRQVETPEDMAQALAEENWDVVLSDFSLPRFDAPAALAILQASGHDIPFIIISGTIGEETAVRSLQAGAHDFMLKAQLARLIPALERELRDAQGRREHRRAEGELRAKELELRAMTEQLWQAARLATMGELAASIAHELNNPLAIITLRIEQLKADLPPDSPQRRQMEVIEAECERMTQLVASLLDSSRRSTPQISTVNVCAEATQTLDLVSYQMRLQNIDVQLRCADDAPQLRADRQQLRQLFLNLFTNAKDAMPSGGALTVRVGPLPNSGDERSVLIEVIDTGTGIAPADLERIWEPFFTTKPVGQGTGLGLAICRRIAQDHAGTIDVASQAGQGTTVRIVLAGADESNGTALRSD